VRYEFIGQHHTQFRIAALCRVLRVSRVPGARVHANERLLADIRRVHWEHREAYGALKTWRALNRQGVACGKHRVARLRREAGIEAKRKRRFRVMTEHQQRPAPAPDLLNRQFRTQAPDQAWVGDMTFIRTRQGWLHLAVLLDLFSRRIVGWAMHNQPGQTLTHTALTMALVQRQPAAGLIHHTDRGSPYSARGYGEQLSARGIRPSMSGRKSAYDNAVAESFFSSLKNELIHHCDFATRDHARTAIFEYIELFYNRKRIHQSLGYRTPVEVERAWYGA
jgi:transposase InsO family protein